MKMILASIFTTALIIAMTLGAMFTLVSATVYVTSIVSPAQRAVAIGAELLLGVVLLLGTTWLATHLAATGTKLRAGDIVMTGSLALTRFPDRACTYCFGLDGLGAVEVSIRP